MTNTAFSSFSTLGTPKQLALKIYKHTHITKKHKSKYYKRQAWLISTTSSRGGKIEEKEVTKKEIEKG